MKSGGEHLWEHYARDRSSALKEQLLASYAGLVTHVVRKFTQSIGESEQLLESSDLSQAGMIGLLEAIDKFDPSRGVKFETYALVRVQGAIQDQLRKVDWLPRSERKRLRLADEVLQHLRTTGGDELAVRKFSEERSLSTDEYYDFAAQSERERFDPSGEIRKEVLENIAAEGSENPHDETGPDELKRQLLEAVKGLPQRDRLIITLHYYEGLKFNAIAKLLKMSESRVSQIHGKVIHELRDLCADTQ